MSSLVLHCGAESVTEYDVRSVDTPSPTKTWSPVPHAWLLDTVRDFACSQGMVPTRTQHGLTTGGARYFGLINFDCGDDYTLAMGLRNDHGKTLGVGLLGGSNVFICDNLAFSAEYKMTRRRTSTLLDTLEGDLWNMVSDINTKARTQIANQIDIYKNLEFSSVMRDHVLIEAAKADAISWSGISKVYKELEEPTHTAEEFGVSENSAWFLFNAVTETLKTRVNGAPDPAWTQSLHRVFDAVAAA